MPVTDTDTWEDLAPVRDLANRINALGLANSLPTIFPGTTAEEYIADQTHLVSRYRFLQTRLETLVVAGFGLELTDWRVDSGIDPEGFTRWRYFTTDLPAKEKLFGVLQPFDIIGVWIFNEIEAGVIRLESE